MTPIPAPWSWYRRRASTGTRTVLVFSPVTHAADIDVDEVRFGIKADPAALQSDRRLAERAQVAARQTNVDGLADGMQTIVGNSRAVGAQVVVGAVGSIT